jgi:copper(I)-binding protein
VNVTHAWARATPGAVKIGGAYLTLSSPGGDTLTGAASPVADKVEIHEHQMVGEVMKMRRVDAVPLPPGETVTLKPSGFHIMLIGLKDKLVEGQSFPLTLEFAKAGKVETNVMVEAAGAAGPMAMDHK